MQIYKKIYKKYNFYKNNFIYMVIMFNDTIYNLRINRYQIFTENDILNDFNQNITIIKDDVITTKESFNIKQNNNSNNIIINTNDSVINPEDFFNNGLKEIKKIF